MRIILLMLAIVGAACIFASCTEEVLSIPHKNTGGEEEPVLPKP